jgi:hypothetical protein
MGVDLDEYERKVNEQVPAPTLMQPPHSPEPHSAPPTIILYTLFNYSAHFLSPSPRPPSCCAHPPLLQEKEKENLKAELLALAQRLKNAKRDVHTVQDDVQKADNKRGRKQKAQKEQHQRKKVSRDGCLYFLPFCPSNTGNI